jgi:dUTP pyrophosphatase
MSTIAVRILRLPQGEGLPYPAYMTPDSAGADCFAAVNSPVILEPFARALIPLGFSLGLPAGYEAQLRPRSGLALRQGITLLNSPGTIDADYRGPVGVILINFGSDPVTISRGDRVAQMILAPVVRAEFVDAESLEATERSGGFGSTGINNVQTINGTNVLPVA